MNIEIFDELDSTNDYLKRKKGTQNFDIVVAHKQTKGRGSRGRVWLSTEGVLMFSFIIKEEKYCSIEEYMKLPLVVGIALLDGLVEIENLPFMFKWTNDIYLYDKKLSGILIEKSDDNFIVGIGINLNITEFENLNANSLKLVTGKDYEKIGVVKTVVKKVQEYLSLFYRGDWEILLQKINEKNYLKDKKVKFSAVDREYNGIVKGINIEGELLLEEKNIVHKLKLGEVTSQNLH